MPDDSSREGARTRWKMVHEHELAGGRGKWTYLLEVAGGWLVLVKATDETTWGGLTFVPDPEHATPPQP